MFSTQINPIWVGDLRSDLKSCLFYHLSLIFKEFWRKFFFAFDEHGPIFILFLKLEYVKIIKNYFKM
jgi:hypothetical protein